MTVAVLDGGGVARNLGSLLVASEHAIMRTMVGSDDGSTGRIVLTDASGRIVHVGAALHDAAAAGAPLLQGGYASAAAPSDVSGDGDAVRLWALRNGALAINVTAAGALIPGDASNGLDVDVTRLPSLVAGNANIGDVDVASIAAGDNNIGNVDIVTMPSLPAGTNNIGDVDVLSLPALPAGSNAIGTVTAVGGAAHDAAVSGNPVLVAGYASAAAPTGVTDGDAVRAWHLANGAAATVVTAAGALIGGDATNGLDVDVTRVAIPSTVYAGQTNVTTPGTEVTLASSQAVTQGVWIKAKHANTGFIYVGLNGVTSTTGFVLDAGETIFVPIANLNTIYLDCSVGGEGVSYIGF